MHLQRALEAFVMVKEVEGLSPRTLEFYRDNCGRFIAWLSREPIRNGDWCQPRTIRHFLAHEKRTRNLSPHSVHARYRALRAWFAWIEEEYGISSPVANVKPPKVPRRQPRKVEIADVEKLISSVSADSDDWTDLRDRLALGLLFWTGLRLGEMCNLEIGDIRVKERLVKVREGKGSKDRIVPFPSEFGPLVLRYLMTRPPWSGPELFVSNDGAGGIRGPLTRGGMRHMIRRRCAQAGIQYQNPHSFRHGFAMAILNSGEMEIEMLSKLMGHSSTAITRSIYADWVEDSIRRDYDEAVRKVRRGRS